jgi:lactoylglutathione lyase
MASLRLHYAIVFVSDMSRSVAFYRDILGLPLHFESPAWSEFATDGATLALHKADAPGRGVDEHHHAGDCRPGLRVANLDEFHARLLDYGVVCLQPPTLTFGSRLAQYVDPDGLTISVSETERVEDETSEAGQQLL